MKRNEPKYILIVFKSRLKQLKANENSKNLKKVDNRFITSKCNILSALILRCHSNKPNQHNYFENFGQSLTVK